MAASVIRLPANAPRDMTGLAGGSDGRVMILHNVGNFTITLRKESSLSAAQNRFALASDLPLAPNQSCLLQYDAISARWRALATADEGWSPVPASPTSSGIAGQKAYSDAWLYICVATNTWRRTALATWGDSGFLLLESGSKLLSEAGGAILKEV